jgi:hypothetical protein
LPLVDVPDTRRFFPGARITVIERVGRSVKIAWHDPTACRYGDQCWHRATARRSGVCAITGAPITRGMDIFRPSCAGPAPVNAYAMILASALPDVRRSEPVESCVTGGQVFAMPRS